MRADEPIVVFDVGNVLIEWEPRQLYRKLFADPERMEWFLAEVATGPWNAEMDRGRPFADGIAELVARHPALEAEIRAFDERWNEMVPGAIAANVAVLERLRASGRRTYAITNFSREKWQVATRRFPFLAGFDGLVVSAHERLLKPEPAIYRLLLERNGLEAGRCIFLDDSPLNIEGARAVGMAAIQVTPELDLAAALREAGVDV